MTSLKSKYLHLFQVTLEQFEKRFPGTDGFWRMSIAEGDVQPIFDMIKEKSDAVRQAITEHYSVKQLPLAFLAPLVGGEEIGLSQYLKLIEIDLVVSDGSHQEREAAIATCKAMRGRGAVLDTYTAWTCAEMGVLHVLKQWFGTLSVPQSTIQKIDHLIAKEEAGLGQKGMSVGWHNGQFLRHDIDDDHIRRQIRALNEVKASLLLHCEIATVDLPNDIATDVASIVRKVGPGCVDPIYLALDRQALLLCEDQNYRRFAVACGVVKGVWLQSALAAAANEEAIGREAYAKAVIQIAARRHGPVGITPDVMSDIFELGDMPAFAAVCKYLGGPSADMWSHVSVVSAFLAKQWSTFPHPPHLQAATSIVLASINSGRKDWTKWFGLLWCQSRNIGDLVSYFAMWTHGYLIFIDPIN